MRTEQPDYMLFSLVKTSAFMKTLQMSLVHIKDKNTSEFNCIANFKCQKNIVTKNTGHHSEIDSQRCPKKTL